MDPKIINAALIDKLNLEVEIDWDHISDLDIDHLKQLDQWVDQYNHSVKPDKSISSSYLLATVVLEEIIDLMVADTYANLSQVQQSQINTLTDDLAEQLDLSIENLTDGDIITLVMLHTIIKQDKPLDQVQSLTIIPELENNTDIRKYYDQFMTILPADNPFQNIVLQAISTYPDSVADQLSDILSSWDQLDPLQPIILRTIDLIREQTKLRVGGPGEVLVPEFDDTSPEAYTEDKDWMPKVILLAKHTKVWLHQLSRKYGTSITTLDQIPDAELSEITSRGFTGLWLIGLWERSKASQKIKQRMGNPEAAASAYSLWDYSISKDLGGYTAYKDLFDRADQIGLRLASDMVPNHTGIMSKWIVEHPDWFIQTRDPPFPSYEFQSENLADHQHVKIFLEDHYYSHEDASVVFKRVDTQNNDVRYIYHGNDGTSIPWNDTAQLDFLKEEVREQVINSIIQVANKFSIIRLDAAMVLTKQHFQRLWYPVPGTGGDIPSRSRYSMTREEFNALFPVEFWREVVDRIELEAPNTLLVAEAFWMLEGYFVRSLGVHRVYNSAFMHMLRDQKNEEYRELIKSTLTYDPRILERYVNFMSNPDEDTAIEQFDNGDKYFGITVMMATLPGMPMFGHGQIEGYREKYGMEFQRDYWEETPDKEFIKLHEQLIFPLLRKRYIFAQAKSFRLYDYYQTDGQVIENVYALSNHAQGEFMLVLYNNSIEQSTGWIKDTLPFNAKKIEVADMESYQSNLINEIQQITTIEETEYCIFKNFYGDQYYIRSLNEIKQKGLYIELNGYQFQIFTLHGVFKQNEEIKQFYDRTGGVSVSKAELPSGII